MSRGGGGRGAPPRSGRSGGWAPHPSGGRNAAAAGHSDTDHTQRRRSGGSGLGDNRTESWADLGEEEFAREALASGAAEHGSAAARRARRKKKRDVAGPLAAHPGGRAGVTNAMWHRVLGQRWAAPPVLCRRSRSRPSHRDLRDELDAANADDLDYDEDSECHGSGVHRAPPARAKLPIRCKFWHTGCCKRGAECVFLHGDEDLDAAALAAAPPVDPAHGSGSDTHEAPPDCCLNWYYTGRCPNGEHCKLPHFVPEDYYAEQAAGYYGPEVEAAYSAAAAPAEVPVCSRWLQGNCRYGDACELRHLETTPPAAPPPPQPQAAPPAAVPALVAEFSATFDAAAVVLHGIRELRGEVEALRGRLHASEQRLLTRAFQMVLGSLDEQPREVLLGLSGEAVGLTRFRSVLMKRTLKWAFESSNLIAIESLARWERHLVDRGWVQAPPADDGEFCRYFEANLCGHFLECLRAMAASPFARCRSNLAGGADNLSIPDATSQALALWAAPAPQVARAGVDHSPRDCPPAWPEWAPEDHQRWPAPFRGRLRAAARALHRRHRTIAADALRGAAAFLPPLSEGDVPPDERAPGEHPFLDIAAAALANQALDVIGAEESGAHQRLGEAIWPLVVASCGEERAPRLTGMLLQMPPEALLLDAVNTKRFDETLLEAWEVLCKADGAPADR